MIDPKCDKCGEELDKPGGLAFAPPSVENLVRKYHLCALCWYKFVNWLNYNENFHPGYD